MRKPGISSVFLFKIDIVIAKARPIFRCTRNDHNGRACGNLQDKAQIHAAMRHNMQIYQVVFMNGCSPPLPAIVHYAGFDKH
jgi:hypothetical protein